MKLSSSLAIVAVLLFGELPRYRINTTDSLPRGLYQETQRAPFVGVEPLTRGVIVMECLPPDLAALGKERGWIPKGSCPGNAGTILKRVVGLPGDTVELGKEYVAVNDKLIFNSATRETDSKGRPVSAFTRGIFTLKADEVFLLATNSERSWDGRYTGPAKIRDVIATFKPVWVEAK